MYSQAKKETLRLLNALIIVRIGVWRCVFSLATITFETFERILCQMLSSQGKNAPSNPYPHYSVRLATSRLKNIEIEMYSQAKKEVIQLKAFSELLRQNQSITSQLLRESFCESGEGVRLPRERGWPPGKSGNFRGSLGNFRGSPANFRGTPGLLLNSTVRELPGKSPKSFRGSSGNFRGSRGTSQKLGGAWLPSSDSPNLSPNYEILLGDVNFLGGPASAFPLSRAWLAIRAAIYRSAQGPGPESAPRSAFQCFWAHGSECPKECFLSAFWPFWG